MILSLIMSNHLNSELLKKTVAWNMASPVYFVTRIFKISDSSSLFSYSLNISGSLDVCLKMKKVRYMFFSFFFLDSKEKGT